MCITGIISVQFLSSSYIDPEIQKNYQLIKAGWMICFSIGTLITVSLFSIFVSDSAFCAPRERDNQKIVKELARIHPELPMKRSYCLVYFKSSINPFRWILPF